jgi:hypothetical protein
VAPTMKTEESIPIAERLLEKEGAVTPWGDAPLPDLEKVLVAEGSEEKPKALVVLVWKSTEDGQHYTYLIDPRQRKDAQPIFMTPRETIEPGEPLLSAFIRAAQEEVGYSIDPTKDELFYLGTRNVQRMGGTADPMPVAIVFMSQEPQIDAKKLDCLGRIKILLTDAAKGGSVGLEGLQQNSQMYAQLLEEQQQLPEAKKTKPPLEGTLGTIKPEHLPILQEVVSIVAAKEVGQVPPRF